MAGKKKRTTQQIGRASKQKGARFELEIAHYFRDNGYPEACRTAQRAGKGNGKADVEGVPGLWIECKHQEKMQLYPWMNQAVRDCTAKNTGDIPVVVHKQNRKETLVTMSIDDFIQIYSASKSGGEKGASEL